MADTDALRGEHVSPQSLVVRSGDRVVAEGTFVRRDDGDWLDLAQVINLVDHGPGWVSHRAVRVTGVEPARIPDRLTVTGRWTGEAIDAESHEPYRPPRTYSPRFDEPAPPGGWDAYDRHTDIDGLAELRESGAIAADDWQRLETGALILRVAACDVERVEAVLAPQLPRRLFLVRSEYDARVVREVEQALYARSEEWLVDSFSSPLGLGASCQPHSDALLACVRQDLADWAENLPPGLLTLHPAMRPANPS